MAARNPKLALLLLLVMLLIASSEAQTRKLKETEIMLYMQDWESGSNVTAVRVAGIPGNRWWTLGFGTLYICDNALTYGIDRNSKEMGRARGIYAISALDGSDIHMVMSFVFTNEEYNGSSLEIQGANRALQRYREVSIVSGTGKFRFARGYATLETVYLDIRGQNAIIRWNITVLHY